MPERADFLVEIGTEELPPRALPQLSAAFADALALGLEATGLAFDNLRPFATPRRLAVIVHELELSQPERAVEMRGPPERVAFDAEGTPTRAATAFAEKCGVDVGELERVQTDKGTWLVHRRLEPGRRAAELLPGLVGDALEKLPVLRPMRWGANEIEFVRPVHWVVLLLGTEVLDASVLGVRATRSTRGHRFHAGGPIELREPAEYATRLEHEGYVVPAFDERRARIRRSVSSVAAELGGAPVGGDALFDEVTALVEWPVALSAGFDARFLSLPEEVLIETLQAHQRYFPVRAADGKLLARFITVSNIDSAEPEQVRAGNERVVIPRLADAEFFYNADRRVRLADRVEALDGVVFQRKLGTLHDKMRRVETLAGWLAERLDLNPVLAARAARLAKCDLLTEMVTEFPSLQGTMGRYYAAHDGEPPEVAQAIEEQYLPRFAGDALPASGTGRVLSMADKIDTLAGIFAIGQRPSGTRDPFALRRSALGLLRTMVEGELDIDLQALIDIALKLQPVETPAGEVGEEIYQYCLDRLRAWYLDGSIDGVSAQMFEAVAARRPASALDFHARMLAVRDFARLEAAESLSAANKRIANILRTAEDEIPPAPDPAAFEHDAERELYAELERVRSDVTPLLARQQYGPALGAMAELRPAVDRYFDDVMVMTDDDTQRRNRLALLGQLRELFLHTADLSRLPG